MNNQAQLNASASPAQSNDVAPLSVPEAAPKPIVTRVIGPKAVGRPRQYESAAERQKAYRERKKAKV